MKLDFLAGLFLMEGPMKNSKFSESGIVAILKDGKAGVAVKQILRKHGITRATYYGWKSK